MGIMTVNGVISRDKLGITTPHEHALIDISNQYPGDRTPGSVGWDGKVSREYYDKLMADPYALRDNLMLDDEETAIAEVARFAAAGGRSFVDVTTPCIGRDVRFLQRLAERTGLNVVVACGFYTADAHHPRLAKMSIDELADEMTAELNTGIDGTGIRAGIIGEIGTSLNILESEVKVLRAAAIAHRRSGAPVMVHLNPWGGCGNQAVDILMEAGVPANRIALCHMDVPLDLADMRRVLDRGVYLEFDNFGKEFTSGSAYGAFPSDADRMEVLYQLIADGYSKQLLLSCDVCLKNLLTIHGGPGYDHILTGISKMIKAKYPADEAELLLKTLLIDNPADYLDNPLLG